MKLIHELRAIIQNCLLRRRRPQSCSVSAVAVVFLLLLLLLLLHFRSHCLNSRAMCKVENGAWREGDRGREWKEDGRTAEEAAVCPTLHSLTVVDVAVPIHARTRFGSRHSATQKAPRSIKLLCPLPHNNSCSRGA